jgi:hypothetical protein
MHCCPAWLFITPLLQVARLEQRVLAVSTECEALSGSLDEARSAADGARSAAHAALEGLGQQPRECWPRSVLLVVTAAEAAVREEAAQKAVSAGATGAGAHLLASLLWCQGAVVVGVFLSLSLNHDGRLLDVSRCACCS